MIPTEEPREFRNWMYMGPGIWFDTVHRLLHIRLSHTTTASQDGLDYTGITDPRKAKLTLAKSLTPALKLTDCTNLR